MKILFAIVDVVFIFTVSVNAYGFFINEKPLDKFTVGVWAALLIFYTATSLLETLSEIDG